ncbi:UDP-N-acetylmuramoyl-tripeptide--D-alanyl-D-alanine ligase [Marivirga lumbricoides]|uniref:UDP-N-acetylmuramoyl-tripeptide--D-alanyl-D-alanine ligase n=1 Tax=Marivirga lumbricoides TaxID=1046115 RepID=A0A2T4DUW4_9BACT|nr:UDP-N-acetylmuramoyl-tripeptide--D-alanyl-D-alanine ligase [Marivirga lumbricoides]
MPNIDQLHQLFLKSTGICTDTRKLKQGNLFFALKGPNFNGNLFAEKALNEGAIAVVIDEPEYDKGGESFILVENALKYLQNLASYHRDQLKIPVIGITGSNGKTTTKELMQTALSAKFKTFATRGNLNNHIGVPLSILAIDDTFEMAIIEMGANHVGEIASYCKIAKPTHGLITNIGKAHIGEFGGFENIVLGKSELFDYLKKNNGIPFVNTNDAVLKNMQKRFENAVTYPNEHDYYPANPLTGGVFLELETATNVVSTHLVGQYNFMNVAAALCVAKFFEVPEEAAEEAVATYQPKDMRSQLIKTKHYNIISDAYNANPDSMEVAIKGLVSAENSESVVILGDMMELGELSELEHEKVGEIAVDLGVSKRFYIGKLIKAAKKTDKFGKFFENKDEFIAYLKEHPIKHGSTILLKGSRKNALEDLLPYFEE